MIQLFEDQGILLVGNCKRQCWFDQREKKIREINNISIHGMMALIFRAGFINVKGRWLTLPGPHDICFLFSSLMLLKTSEKHEFYGLDLSHYVSAIIVPSPQKDREKNRISQPRNYHFWNFWWKGGGVWSLLWRRDLTGTS